MKSLFGELFGVAFEMLVIVAFLFVVSEAFRMVMAL